MYRRHSADSFRELVVHKFSVGYDDAFPLELSLMNVGILSAVDDNETL